MHADTDSSNTLHMCTGYDLWEIAFVIQDDQNPIWPLADEVEARLVVLVIHMVPGDSLTQVFLLQRAGQGRGSGPWSLLHH